MSSGGKDRGTRESRERTRVYQARQTFHDSRIRRRRRDNLIAGIVGGLVIVGIVAVQTLYFTTGPGMPVPTPTSTSTPAPTPSVAPEAPVTETPAPEATPTTTP
ncbi:hypothetical protein QL996_00030 [Planococcus sp. APC 4015]|nr:hypothetical protein [Planococcus sp. APC 4015]